MNSISIMTRWNVIDSIIYFAEKSISKLVDSLKNSRDELPDPEEMIIAATRELQKENDELKQYRLPGHLINQGENYICPVCKKEVADIEGLKNNKVKYCSGCGKRIIIPQESLYVKYANNLVKEEDNKVTD